MTRFSVRRLSVVTHGNDDEVATSIQSSRNHCWVQMMCCSACVNHNILTNMQCDDLSDINIAHLYSLHVMFFSGVQPMTFTVATR